MKKIISALAALLPTLLFSIIRNPFEPAGKAFEIPKSESPTLLVITELAGKPAAMIRLEGESSLFQVGDNVGPFELTGIGAKFVKLKKDKDEFILEL